MLIPSKRVKSFLKIIPEFFEDLDDSNYWIDKIIYRGSSRYFPSKYQKTFLSGNLTLKLHNVYFFGKNYKLKPNICTDRYMIRPHFTNFFKMGNQLFSVGGTYTLYKSVKDINPVEKYNVDIINFNYGCKFILRDHKIVSDPMDYIVFESKYRGNDLYRFFSFGCPEFEDMVKNYKILL